MAKILRNPPPNRHHQEPPLLSFIQNTSSLQPPREVKSVYGPVLNPEASVLTCSLSETEFSRCFDNVRYLKYALDYLRMEGTYLWVIRSTIFEDGFVIVNICDKHYHNGGTGHFKSNEHLARMGIEKNTIYLDAWKRMKHHSTSEVARTYLKSSSRSVSDDKVVNVVIRVRISSLESEDRSALPIQKFPFASFTCTNAVDNKICEFSARTLADVNPSVGDGNTACVCDDFEAGGGVVSFGVEPVTKRSDGVRWRFGSAAVASRRGR
ncbi:unnamed protein product [Acanthoscelides obtectus]|uniref:Uncharacterized protein n=1 Tax=Acanthoscelides obtectus TaxID=200917 RepID=A0A9P0ME20_ACAOB|nr:unnamed protein product [Acanthoscelides obtectus]CAK1642175.1 hypothetical protein AOBTE_LOCUS12865 [Acanthoscelides obtectus]